MEVIKLNAQPFTLMQEVVGVVAGPQEGAMCDGETTSSTGDGDGATWVGEAELSTRDGDGDAWVGKTHYQRHDCNSFSLCLGKLVPSLSVYTLCKSNHLKLLKDLGSIKWIMKFYGWKQKWSNLMHNPPWSKKWLDLCAMAKLHHQLGMEPYVLVKQHYKLEMEMELVVVVFLGKYATTIEATIELKRYQRLLFWVRLQWK